MSLKGKGPAPGLKRQSLNAVLLPHNVHHIKRIGRQTSSLGDNPMSRVLSLPCSLSCSFAL